MLDSTSSRMPSYAFAIALSRMSNLPLIGLMRGYQIEHAFVRHQNGTLWDIRGPIKKDDPALGAPFGYSMPYDLQLIIEADLLERCPVSAHAIEVACRLAEGLCQVPARLPTDAGLI